MIDGELDAPRLVRLSVKWTRTLLFLLCVPWPEGRKGLLLLGASRSRAANIHYAAHTGARVEGICLSLCLYLGCYSQGVLEQRGAGRKDAVGGEGSQGHYRQSGQDR